MNVHEKIFRNLKKIGVVSDEGLCFDGYVKLESAGFMPLSFELLEDKPPVFTLAMAHYGEMNGDAMADPDMEIRINFEGKTVEALTFQNDYVGAYSRIYDSEGNFNPATKKDLDSFLLQWTQNAIDQGFKHEGVN
jgi:hypothetical protein